MKLLPPLGAAPAPRPGLLARLGLTNKAVDSQHLIFESARFGKKAAGDSADLQRILALPRRVPPTLEEQAEMATEMTARLRRDNARCGCKELRPWAKSPCITSLMPVQGWYLQEASTSGGVLGHVVAGGGKTGIDILLAMVLPWSAEDLASGAARVALLIPPSLRAQFRDDFLLWSQHFRVPNLAGGSGPFVPGRPILDVLAYSELSHEKCATWLRANSPKVIIADEAHNLKDKDSVRTGRFLRYFIEAENVALFAHSGTLTTRSPDDYGHLSTLALREGSPLPLETSALKEWCDVLAPTNGPPAPIGALRHLCEVGEPVRSGFRRRLVDTRGVITTEDARVAAHLKIIKRDPGPIPPSLEEALVYARKGTRPDWLAPGSLLPAGEGEELVEQMEVATVARQLAAGFFYRWKYPRGEPEELILKWLKKRGAFSRELRGRLENRTDGMDSPGLLRAAAGRALEGYRGELPVWRSETFAEWQAIEPLVVPEQDTVWLDFFLACDAVAWARESPGVVWYGHTAWGRKVAELGGLPFFGGGEEASELIKQERGDRSIVASIKAHGTGKNLQMFSRALVGNPPSDAGIWEQLLARHHRQGQEATEVKFYVYRHTEEMRSAMDSALEYASYCQETTGKAERLLFAEKALT